MLVGTGISFYNFWMRGFNILDLKLPSLTEDGRRELLAHQLRELSLSDSDIESCLEDPSLQSLSADTMGIPGAGMQLMQAIKVHYGKGHEIGRYIYRLLTCKKAPQIHQQKPNSMICCRRHAELFALFFSP